MYAEYGDSPAERPVAAARLEPKPAAPGDGCSPLPLLDRPDPIPAAGAGVGGKGKRGAPEPEYPPWESIADQTAAEFGETVVCGLEAPLPGGGAGM